MAHLTVKDIAARISSDPAESARTVRQIKHWTLLGLLEPIGPKHGGTGRARLYDDTAVYIAMVLTELAVWGVSVDTKAGAAAEILKFAPRLQDGRTHLEMAIEGDVDVVMALQQASGDRGDRWWLGDIRALPPMDATSRLMIDLTVLFKRVQGA